MIILDRPGAGELEPCRYELVGVFYLEHVIAKFGIAAAGHFAEVGNPRKYWNASPGKYARSIVIERLSMEGTEHSPSAIFVATSAVNSGRPFPPSTEVAKYRESCPYLLFDANWRIWPQDILATLQQITPPS